MFIHVTEMGKYGKQKNLEDGYEKHNSQHNMKFDVWCTVHDEHEINLKFLTYMHNFVFSLKRFGVVQV
jgi:hypothetical protein